MFLNRANDRMSGISVYVTNDNGGTFHCEQTSSCLANAASSASYESNFALGQSEPKRESRSYEFVSLFASHRPNIASRGGVFNVVSHTFTVVGLRCQHAELRR
jgi:hypothetical protein